jgi:hypothetical protein
MSVELEIHLQNEKTAQNGPESAPSQPKRIQPKNESDPTKGQKQGRRETDVALFSHRRNQSHKLLISFCLTSDQILNYSENQKG